MRPFLSNVFVFFFLINFSALSLMSQNGFGVEVFESEQKRNHNRFVGLRLNGGFMLPTDDFVRSFDLYERYYQSLTVRFGFRSTGESWLDRAFGMPYIGLGLSVIDFPAKRANFGTPFALYMINGGTIHEFNSTFSLKYEWHLGASFNWKYYDAISNPQNITIGSPLNAYASVGAFVNWQISPRIDMSFGASVNHYSNGSTRLPNRGMNQFSPFVELNYSLDKNANDRVRLNPNELPSTFKRRMDYDLMLTVSSHQITADSNYENLPARYIDYNFPIIGLSFTPLVVPNRRYKYGISLDFLYDKSRNVKVWEIEQNGNMLQRISFAPPIERLSVGFSARGEMTMPLYTVFCNIGYNVFQLSEGTRAYQTIGIKVYPHENLYATFAVRTTYFSQAKYIAWSVGYVFEGNPRRLRK